MEPRSSVPGPSTHRERGLAMKRAVGLRCARPGRRGTGPLCTGAGVALLSLALVNSGWAELDSPGLLTVAATPLKVTPTPAGALDIQAGPGQALKDCRPYLASRSVGTQAWTEETSGYKVIAEDAQKIVLEAPFAWCKATVVLRRDAAGRWEFSGRLDSTVQQPMELARFHYLDGLVADAAMNLLSMRQFELPGRIVKPSEKLASPRTACQKGWGGVHWPRLAEPVHDQPNVAISGDTGMLAADWNSRGFFLGFTGPGSAFGELGIANCTGPDFVLRRRVVGCRSTRPGRFAVPGRRPPFIWRSAGRTSPLGARVSRCTRPRPHPATAGRLLLVVSNGAGGSTVGHSPGHRRLCFL